MEPTGIYAPFSPENLIETDLMTITYVSSTLGIKQIIDLITSLATLKLDDKDADKVTNFMERVGRLNTKQNVLAHGHWILELMTVVENGDAAAKSQFARYTEPPEPRMAELITKPRNRKERVKYIFALKRILGAAKDAATIAKDLGIALQEIRLSRPWKERKKSILSKDVPLDALWSMHRIDPTQASRVKYAILL
jgi:hypothetical protein